MVGQRVALGQRVSVGRRVLVGQRVWARRRVLVGQRVWLGVGERIAACCPRAVLSGTAAQRMNRKRAIRRANQGIRFTGPIL
jgi:UDP-3-O-[3-hydroxymyristoyl] glucosamine N-acyltransferase